LGHAPLGPEGDRHKNENQKMKISNSQKSKNLKSEKLQISQKENDVVRKAVNALDPRAEGPIDWSVLTNFYASLTYITFVYIISSSES
jgi:hypothetical protein